MFRLWKKNPPSNFKHTPGELLEEVESTSNYRQMVKFYNMIMDASHDLKLGETSFTNNQDLATYFEFEGFRVERAPWSHIGIYWIYPERKQDEPKDS